MSSVTRTYFMLTVSDMARAVAFYRGVLDSAVRSEADSWTELKLGEATVALHKADAPSPRHTGLGVEVSDLDITYHAVLEGGGQIMAGPITDPYGRLSYEVADTDGNTFTISGAVPDPTENDPTEGDSNEVDPAAAG